MAYCISQREREMAKLWGKREFIKISLGFEYTNGKALDKMLTFDCLW